MEEQLINKATELAKKFNNDDIQVIHILISNDDIKIRCRKKENIFVKIYNYILKYISEKNQKMIVLDTSALESKKSMEYIEKAKRVIILPNILQEFDNNKKQKNLLGYNIRRITDEILKDDKQTKYICEEYKGPYLYSDDNTIKYCIRYKRKVILLTGDKNLAVKAKSNKIEYILLDVSNIDLIRTFQNNTHENLKNENYKKSVEETKPNYVPEDIEKAVAEEKNNKDIQKKVFTQFIIPFEIKNNIKRSIDRLSVYHKGLFVMNEKEELLPENTIIYLEEGYIIYKVTKNKKNVCVNVYKYVLKSNTEIEQVKKYMIYCVNEIYIYIKNEVVSEAVRKIIISNY